MLLIKKPFLFCSSYSPLIIMMLLLIKSNTNSDLYELIQAISLISIELGYIFLHYAFTNTTTGPKTHTIRDIENKNDLLHTYLMPYIIFVVSLMDYLQ